MALAIGSATHLLADKKMVHGVRYAEVQLGSAREAVKCTCGLRNQFHLAANHQEAQSESWGLSEATQAADSTGSTSRNPCATGVCAKAVNCSSHDTSDTILACTPTSGQVPIPPVTCCRAKLRHWGYHGCYAAASPEKSPARPPARSPTSLGPMRIGASTRVQCWGHFASPPPAAPAVPEYVTVPQAPGII